MAEEAKRVSARYNVLLAVILILIVGYYALFEVDSPPEEMKTLRGESIYLIEPWDVKTVQVIADGGKELLAERQGDRWRIKEGKQIDGFEAKVDDFVANLLMTVEIDKFPFEENLLSECGLDNPSYTITITDITDKSYTLFAGDKTPVGTCLYTRFADTPQIVVVGALLDYELGKVDSLME